MTIALWYCPLQGTPAYETLELIIISLQSLFPNSPVFEPHITITSDLVCSTGDDVNKILTSCVAAIRSVRNQQRQAPTLISFKACSVGKHYFRKVVLECNENRYLYSIAQVMREVYVEIEDASRSQRAATWARDEFKPHLSLLYSDVTPISQAFLRVIQQRIEDVLNIQMVRHQGNRDTQLYWDFPQQPALSWGLPGTFKVVRCEGPVENWRVLGKTDV